MNYRRTRAFALRRRRQIAAPARNQIRVGSVAVAACDFLFINGGNKGVCVKVRTLEDGKPSYFFIFETGEYNLYIEEEAKNCLHLEGVHPSLANYELQSFEALAKDFSEGRFDAAFSRRTGWS